jgi:hypothetical protein
LALNPNVKYSFDANNSFHEQCLPTFERMSCH